MFQVGSYKPLPPLSPRGKEPRDPMFQRNFRREFYLMPYTFAIFIREFRDPSGTLFPLTKGKR